MAITFNAPEDPWGMKGIQQGIGTLGQALMQRGQKKQQEASQVALEQRAQERKLADEQRAMEQQKLGSQTLGKTLSEMQPKEGEQWDQNRVNQFMTQALQQGAPVKDVLESVKSIQAGQPKVGSAANTPFNKQMAKTNVEYLTKTKESGRVAKEMLETWDDLDAAILDPERSSNAVARTLKSTPAASLFYSKSDQILATKAKEVITNFTNMKGLRLSDAKLKWLESIAMSPSKTTEANMEASQYFKRIAQIQNAYGDISSSMADSYAKAGLDLPPNFQQLVDEAVQPLNEEIDALYKNRNKMQSSQEKPLEQGSSVDKMPPPKNNEGMLIEDDKGQKYRSNGTKWIKE
jgi:hypothetical protein